MSFRVRIHKNKFAPAPAKPATKKPVADAVGKTVRYRMGDGPDAVDLMGVVRKQEGKTLFVAPAVPNHAGVLYVAKEATFPMSLDMVDVVDIACKDKCGFKAFETSDPLVDTKATSVVKDGDRVVDYVGVTFDGLGSTFQHVTPEDRDGDYILAGAFTNTLRSFKANPVMLTDHVRSVKNLMGHYDKIGITAQGLALKGIVTDSPHPDAVHVRFQIVEKSLKTLSIGGFFYYLEDYRGIEEVDLHETSLVVIPANPDATFNVRAITGEVIQKAYARHLSLNGGELRVKNHA